ncbi:MAG TPA: DUF5916 domain-containing protein [Gemmatimonadaceae bacterium]|nr:DUF5916 domain-containing protein [Gemmatimonadaceae bacterium]
MFCWIRFVVLSLGLAAVPSVALTQGRGPANGAAGSDGHAVPVPSATAARRSAPISLDGRLDDAAWSAATPVREFTQVDPDEGQPASQRTEMRFLFDDGALYVGARMFDTEGRAGVSTSLVRRDAPFNSDFIEIVIDGFHDHLGRAFFQVNPSGSKFDMLGIGTSCCDEGWDPIWEAATGIDDAGWTAEVRIPLNQLRFSQDSVQTWGLQLRRWIQRRQELAQWAFWRKTESGGPNRFGHLQGLVLPRTARQLELMPYVAAKSQNLDTPNGDPFNAGSVQSARLGLDLKYHLSSNLTLDASFNPDFGQVEADPAVVNLTAFETSFPEKRPFFIAGSGVFGFGAFNCYFCSNVASLSAFYSRRIGRSPSGADLAYSSGDYADVPDATTILGAAKITGRTSDGWTIGLLDAVTDREEARVRLADGTDATHVVEPLTNYFVGRLKKDLKGGDLVLGGIATSVIRRLDDPFASRLTRHAELLGTDFRYTWDERTYSLMGTFAFSSISGDPAVIDARQRAPARYFQRPDRQEGSDGLLTNRLDPTATAMRGAGAYMRLGKDAGPWMWETAVNLRTPGFEANDLAFLTRADYIWYNANVFRYWSQPTTWYRQLNLIVGGQQQTNFDGDLTDRQAHVFVGGLTPGFWNWNAMYIWRPAVADDRLLRGGPVVTRPGGGFTSVFVGSDSRGPLFWNGNLGYSWNTRGGWGRNASVYVTWRPVSSAAVNLGPSWNDSKSLLQYVRDFDDPVQAAFYGRRYLLAGIDQKQLALEMRLNWTFSPTMSFELFAQPLLASGHYYDFKEFDAPRQDAWIVYGRDRGTVTTTTDASGLVTDYTIDPDDAGPAQPFSFGNPDFNFRSLRGNAVFRWEYRPGSVLYVAWAHDRASNSPLGDFDLSRDWNGLRAAMPNNVFLVKASYWMPR